MRIGIFTLAAMLAACSPTKEDGVNETDVVAVPKLDSYEFTAGSWTLKPTADGGEAAVYVDAEMIPLFIVQCERATKRVTFKLAGDLPDGTHTMRVETDSASDTLPAIAGSGDVALVEASATGNSKFVAALSTGTKRIGARVGSDVGFLAPGSDMVVKTVRACR